jgi:hypothetical protein
VAKAVTDLAQIIRHPVLKELQLILVSVQVETNNPRPRRQAAKAIPVGG